MRLPVSDLDVAFRLPDGHDDLAIFESRSASRHAAGVEARSMALERGVDTLSRLATLGPIPDTDTSPWHALTITDFEHALLGLRRFLFGDTVACLSAAPAPSAWRSSFPSPPLLRDSQPRTVRRVLPSTTRPGWFALPEKAVGLPSPHGGRSASARLPPRHPALCSNKAASSPTEHETPRSRWSSSGPWRRWPLSLAP